MMDRDTAINLLWETTRDKLRHPNYKRTCDLADKYYRFVTGIGLEKDMQQFTLREDKEMFDQRCRITKHIIPSVVKNLVDVQYKVPRSNSLTRVLAYKGDEENKKTGVFEKILGKFWGDKSFDDYMGIRVVELNNLDPNSFVVVEFKDFDPDQEHLQPYPFEATSEMAVNYLVDNNILQWLIVKTVIELIDENEKEIEGVKHTLYLPERAYVIEQIIDESVNSVISVDDEWVVIGDFWYIRHKKKLYRLEEPEPYNLENVPARRIGYKRDMVTLGAIYVSPWDDTVPILEKTIKANSELDLTMSLHAFPQKIIMGSRCDYENCNKGYIYSTDKNGKEIRTPCPQCNIDGKGSNRGMIVATTTQDTLILSIPGSKEEQLSIDDVAKYLYPPVDLIRFQDEFVENLTWKAKQTMFNSDIFTREEVAETATGKNIDLQNVYDTLWSFAVKFADTWEFFVGIISQLTDMNEDLEFSFSFDKDFKMKSTPELYNDLQKANESGADSFAIEDIQEDIARNIFVNNPEEFQKYKIKQSFYPFCGKTKEEIIAIKSSNNTTRFNKVLDDNFGTIFDLIEMETPDFYKLERKKQWELLQTKVNEIILEITEQTPATKPLESNTLIEKTEITEE